MGIKIQIGVHRSSPTSRACDIHLNPSRLTLAWAAFAANQLAYRCCIFTLGQDEADVLQNYIASSDTSSTTSTRTSQRQQQQQQHPVKKLHLSFPQQCFKDIDMEHWTQFCGWVGEALPDLDTVILHDTLEYHDDDCVATFLSYLSAQTVTKMRLQFSFQRKPTAPIPIPQVQRTLAATSRFVNLQLLNLEGPTPFSIEASKVLAETLTVSLPKLNFLRLRIPITTNEPQGGPIIEAIRTKATLSTVCDLHFAVSDIDAAQWQQVAAALQTFPIIHEAINRYTLLAPSTTHHHEEEDSQRQQNEIRDLRPPSVSDRSNLDNWVSALEWCLFVKNRFDCFHYFFSQMDPLLYLNGKYCQGILLSERSAVHDEHAASAANKDGKCTTGNNNKKRSWPGNDLEGL